MFPLPPIEGSERARLNKSTARAIQDDLSFAFPPRNQTAHLRIFPRQPTDFADPKPGVSD